MPLEPASNPPVTRSLVIVWLAVAAVAVAEAPPTRDAANERARCLKQCAGQPRDARGSQLLACLAQCEESKGTDGGRP